MLDKTIWVGFMSFSLQAKPDALVDALTRLWLSVRDWTLCVCVCVRVCVCVCVCVCVY